MKLLKYLIFFLLIVFIGLAIYIAVQPNSFEVKRTRTIEAPASVIYNNVIDFKNWEAWSSWVEKDPKTVITLDEQTKDIGGSYSWVDQDGNGRMKTIDATENVSIDQELQFGDSEPSNIHWSFSSTPDGKTEVIWKMNSEKIPFMFKAYAAFTGGFDTMIGPDFERGLEKLDSIVVASMKIYSVNVIGLTQHGGGFYLYNTSSCKIDDLKEKMQTMLPQVINYGMSNNTMAGPPFVIYHKWDEENNAVMFSCCIPTTAQVITTESDILTGQLEPFKAVKTILKGDFEYLQEAWNSSFKYIETNNLIPKEIGPMIEVYVTDPSLNPNPADWITEIYIAVE
ncbi:SRPBCC family protein [Formosa maritima]|uniref:Transcription activator effector-binding protein n=1 Tax=Formosa maritima TaxID=2592046 RepID=A0A5D0GEV1_9FLAO|nr:GyrI-like domain-containing protein [Formosa maritima]TYA57538.1 transcription activator effector-binding protein [Formosa maritima]